jgi:hypothetical protein
MMGGERLKAVVAKTVVQAVKGPLDLLGIATPSAVAIDLARPSARRQLDLPHASAKVVDAAHRVPEILIPDCGAARLLHPHLRWVRGTPVAKRGHRPLALAATTLAQSP